MNKLTKILACLMILYNSLIAIDEINLTNEPTNLACRDVSSSSTCALSVSDICYPCGSTTFIPRSQGANTARELVGWQKELFVPFLIPNYGTVAFVFEYTKSFRSCCLAQRLFCTDCLTFAGSQLKEPTGPTTTEITRINGQDVIADNFGLAQDFLGTLRIRPSIQNYIVDLEAFFGLNDISCASFFRVHIPIVHTKWNLGLDDCIVCAPKSIGSPKFPPCYMSSATTQTPLPQPGPVPNPNPNCPAPYQTEPVTTILNCANDSYCVIPRETASSLREALSGNFVFGDMQTPWEFGRWSFCPVTKTGVADADVIFGYNFVQSDVGHVALFAQVVVPTGNRPNAFFLFEPIIGNGKHWELGGGLSTHFSLRCDREYGFNAGVYIEGNATYVFKTHQMRSLDFKNNGLLSRYLLLKEYDVNNFYIGNMINAINFTTRNVDVCVGYKVDFSTKIYIQNCNWIFDFGYNLYARGAETIVLKTDCPCDLDQRRFAIKGTAGVCYSNNVVDLTAGTISETGTTIKSNSFQADATIFAVNNPKPQTISQADLTACGTAQCAPLGYLTAYEQPMYPNTLTFTNINEPKFVLDPQPETINYVTCKDLDLNSAAQCRIFTNKFFTHINYTWYDRCYYPYIGLGGEIEFDSSKFNAGLSQWGIWLKGGVTF